jgi:hypothetical protein
MPYSGRAASASTATGFGSVHAQEQVGRKGQRRRGDGGRPGQEEEGEGRQGVRRGRKGKEGDVRCCRAGPRRATRMCRVRSNPCRVPCALQSTARRTSSATPWTSTSAACRREGCGRGWTRGTGAGEPPTELMSSAWGARQGGGAALGQGAGRASRLRIAAARGRNCGAGAGRAGCAGGEGRGRAGPPTLAAELIGERSLLGCARGGLRVRWADRPGCRWAAAERVRGRGGGEAAGAELRPSGLLRGASRGVRGCARQPGSRSMLHLPRPQPQRSAAAAAPSPAAPRARASAAALSTSHREAQQHAAAACTCMATRRVPSGATRT